MSGFSSRKAFKEFYGKYEKSDQNKMHDKLIGYQNLPFLQERLAHLAFMITKEEAMPDLPKKLYNIHKITMTKRQREAYVNLQKQLTLEIKAKEGKSGKTMLAQHILTKLLQLTQ